MKLSIGLLTRLRLLGESLRPCLLSQPAVERVALAFDFQMLHELLQSAPFQIVLIDVSHGFDAERVRELALRWPEQRFVALGPDEDADEVLRCARAGFISYIPRSASLDDLCERVLEAHRGKVRCTTSIAEQLMRAQFCAAGERGPEDASPLTRRESEIAHLLAEGKPNKEIARQLYLSVATVKHHVHNVLSKRNVSSRVHLISNRVRSVGR